VTRVPALVTLVFALFAVATCLLLGAPRAARLEVCADQTRLACTGLYEKGGGGPSPRVAEGIERYVPGFRLWSDGLDKDRFVYLPPGASIDTRDMDEWVFPVGTRFWKEFRWRGKKIETRYLEKRAAGDWRRTTFVWSDDQREAREDKQGRTLALAEAAQPYDVPSEQDCGRCHGGRRDGVLGFEAPALADAGASGLTLARLERERRLTQPAPPTLAVAGSPLERPALGWLHMNCGVSCHNANPEAGASFAGLVLKWGAAEAGAPGAPAIVRTTVNRPTTVLGFRDPSAPKLRVVPGHPEQSAILHRAGSRAPSLSMPPLATHVVDQEGLATVARWITEMGGK
jgi:hypothetical protein